MPRRTERVILALLLAEVLLFSLTGRNFFSWANAGEIVRLGVELGLLALAMTPVIVSGGIDLSVGALMSLCAVVSGMLWREAGWPIWAAALGAVAVGALGGLLNAEVITRFKQLPLLVTLASFSLFRGLAEGLTGAVKSYTGFPPHYLALGQGYLGGIIPMQALVFIPAIFGFWALLERSVTGRGLYAIGHSEPAARYAGIPVEKRLRLVYLLSGLTSGVAAAIYVAHLGQAKSDAGTGFELMAITAAVLGGTSIFGGVGTIGGTLIGLAAIVVLQNGLRLSAMPAELAGILTGVLLVASIAMERSAGQRTSASRRRLLIAATGLAAIAAAALFAGRHSTESRRIQIGLMPKTKGDPYFISCRKGAEEAAKELGVDLIWDGPTDLDPAKQNEVVEAWITRGVDVIAVSVESQASISTVLRKARSKGIKVITWDADAEPDARDYLIDQATAQGIGTAIADQVAQILGDQGEFAIITGSLTAANQIEWIKWIKARVAGKHPGVKLVAVQPSDSDRDRAFAETQTVLKVHPNVRAIAGIAAPTVPGAAEAVKQSGRSDVQVTGLSLPSLCRPYVHAGIIRSVVLWNTYDLGYLTVYASAAVARGPLGNGFRAGRLGAREIRGDHVMLGEPFLFTRENIDRFDF